MYRPVPRSGHPVQNPSYPRRRVSSRIKSAFSGTLFDWTPACAGVTINTKSACGVVVYLCTGAASIFIVKNRHWNEIRRF